MNIKLVSSNGAESLIDLDPQLLVVDACKKISRTESCPITLLYNGICLDGYKKLEDYKISDGQTVVVYEHDISIKSDRLRYFLISIVVLGLIFYFRARDLFLLEAAQEIHGRIVAMIFVVTALWFLFLQAVAVKIPFKIPD
jgi:hypothetical protein